MRPGLTLPPRGAEVWQFNAYKKSELIYGSWAMKGAHEMEALVYLKGLEAGRYDRVEITYEERAR